MPKKICIIVPCYNEASRLAVEIYLNFLRENAEMDICFVNDGSSDGTDKVLENMQSLCPERILLLNKEQNQGKAEAVRSGIEWVLEKGWYGRVGFMDADLATPLAEVCRLAKYWRPKKIQRSLSGRDQKKGSKSQSDLWQPIWGVVFATIVVYFSDLNAYDTQCGAKIFTVPVAREIFAQTFHSPWLFDVELLLRIRQRHPDYNVIVKEIPLDVWEEKGGSKIRFSHLLKMPFELCAIYRKYR